MNLCWLFFRGFQISLKKASSYQYCPRLKSSLAFKTNWTCFVLIKTWLPNIEGKIQPKLKCKLKHEFWYLISFQTDDKDMMKTKLIEPLALMLGDHKINKPKSTYFNIGCNRIYHKRKVFILFKPFYRPFALCMTNLTLFHCEDDCQEREWLKYTIWRFSFQFVWPTPTDPQIWAGSSEESDNQVHVSDHVKSWAKYPKCKHQDYFFSVKSCHDLTRASINDGNND